MRLVRIAIWTSGRAGILLVDLVLCDDLLFYVLLNHGFTPQKNKIILSRKAEPAAGVTGKPGLRYSYTFIIPHFPRFVKSKSNISEKNFLVSRNKKRSDHLKNLSECVIIDMSVFYYKGKEEKGNAITKAPGDPGKHLHRRTS